MGGSPAVHHPDPNPYELRRSAENPSSELFPPEDLPGSRLFEEFCGGTIKRWQWGDRVIKAKVTRIQPKSGRFRLWFEEGKSAIARRVIVAAGSGKPHLPAWVNQIQTQHPAERIRHSHQVDLRNLQLHGEQILIVGGGLTSGHLAVGSIAREAKVLLMTARYFPEKLGETLFVDRIWLATGTKLDIAAEPTFKEMLETHPIEIVKGLPVLDKHLRWPGCELFLTGGLAALQVGPVARNLSGARMACDRIVRAIVKSSIALSPAIINQQSLVISEQSSVIS